MSKRSDNDWLHDIAEATKRIMTYIKEMTYNTFLDDTKTQDAVIRNLEIIGEATKNLSEECRTKNPNVPWKGMSGMRDRLIHDYIGVNLDIVWDVITVELPKLLVQITKILDKK